MCNYSPAICSFLDEMESAHRDLLLHCTSRWLSCSKALVKFVECLDERNIFLSNPEKHYPELNDEKWPVDLMFFRRYHYTLKRIKSSFARCWSNNTGSFSDVEICRSQTRCLYSRCSKFQFPLCQKSSKSFLWLRSWLFCNWCERFHDFRRFGKGFSFLIKPDCHDGLDLFLFDWMNIGGFRLWLIDIKLKATNYKPNIEALRKEKQEHKFH